jgi:hypothetical protein
MEASHQPPKSEDLIHVYTLVSLLRRKTSAMDDYRGFLGLVSDKNNLRQIRIIPLNPSSAVVVLEPRLRGFLG